MKYIITINGFEYGTYNLVETAEDRYVINGGESEMQFSVVGQGTVSEVADDYKTPTMVEVEQEAAQKAKEQFNESQRQKREAAYKAEADPINFMMQRGEATQQEWLDKIAEIKARFPYQE